MGHQMWKITEKRTVCPQDKVKQILSLSLSIHINSLKAYPNLDRVINLNPKRDCTHQKNYSICRLLKLLMIYFLPDV